MNSKKFALLLLLIFFSICNNSDAQSFDPILQDFYPRHNKNIKTQQRISAYSKIIDPPGTLSWDFTGPEGGRVGCIKIDSSNNTIFAAIPGGGLFTSNDQAQTWTKHTLNDEYNASLYITGLDYNNGRLLAASEGGIYKSMDNGQTWEWLSWTQGYTILSLPEQPDTIMVGVYLSSSWNPVGFVRSNDGGVTWLQCNEGLTVTRITDLDLSPHHPGRVYAATDNGVYLSQNGGMDGWTNISGNLPPGLVISLLCDQFTENTLYVCKQEGLFKSVNGGNDWTDITPVNYTDKSTRIAFQESDSVLYVGTSNGLFMSQDYGNSWQSINRGLQNTVIKAINTDNNLNIMVGTEDGFYMKSRQDTTWRRMVNGLHAFNSECFLFDTKAASATIYTGTGGAGIYYKNSDAGWQDAGVDSGLCYVMDIQRAHDHHAVYAAVIEGYSIKYQDTIFKIFPIQDSTQVRQQMLLPYNIYGGFFTLLAYSQDILFFGGTNGIYRTINGGGDWQLLPYSVKINPVHSIICPENSTDIYAGTQIDPDDYHGIYKSTNMGTTWHNTCRNLYNQLIDIRKICYNPRNPNTMYAANTTGLLKSTDGGESWKIIDEKLIYTDDGVNTVTVHPVDTNKVFVAGCEVYYSDNAGESWQPFPAILPPGSGIINGIAIDPMEPDKIYIATSGNGLLSYKGIETAIAKEKPVAPQLFVLYNNYPNPFNPATQIRYDIPEADHVALQVFDLQGREVATLVNCVKTSGRHLALWNGRDSFGNQAASGVYFYRIRYRDFTETRKMILMR